MMRASVQGTLARVVAVLLSIAAGAAHAQPWPEKPVRIVLPLPAGQVSDLQARAFAAVLTERLKQPVIVENRPGAGGNIGMEHVARSVPDGHTFLLVGSAHVINSHLYRLAFDPLKDLVPVLQVSTQSLVMVTHPSVPATTVAGALALARSRPGDVTCGHATGSFHIACAWLEQAGRADLNLVPYKGYVLALADVIGGRVDMTFGVGLSVEPYVRARRLRAIATTSLRRGQGIYGDLPTIAETLPGFDLALWAGLVAPAGTPPEILERMNDEMQAVLARDDIRKLIVGSGLQMVGGTPRDYAETRCSSASTPGTGKSYASSGSAPNEAGTGNRERRTAAFSSLINQEQSP
jgi:tripartite-type tricarboxylate transporter receptor subunit TctC